MIRWMVDTTVGALARRSAVPDAVETVTVRGHEAAATVPVDAVWERVEALYRTGMHPGIQMCVRHEGQVVIDRAIGHARGVRPDRPFDPDEAVAMQLDTPVNLFSASKAVTGMLMHKLEEQGVLSIDDRVADHVPGFAKHGKGDITLRHVLSHQAGIPTMPRESFDLDMLADPERAEAVLCELRPSAPIGGPPAYHAVVGGFVMEMVARHATGRSLRDILDDEVRRPLGLSRFSFGVDPAEVDLVAENVETGLAFLLPLEIFFHRALGAPWGRLLRMSNDPRFLTAVVPSGNAIVTARDAATFYQCLLNEGEIDGTRVFAADTIARALEPEDVGTPFDRMLGLPMRYSSAFMLGNEGLSLYGWDHRRAFGHLGMSNMLTWADPDRDLVVALLTTGKPMLGTHLLAFPQLIGAIHDTFPDR